MKLVIMEDLGNELRAAIAAAKEAGHVVVATRETYYGSLVATFGERSYDGILTDLSVPNLQYPQTRSECGYQIVEEALRTGVPVVVCSGMNERYPDDLIALVRTKGYRYLSWVDGYDQATDRKRWSEAVQELNVLWNSIQKGG